jgi:hypothetical protein
MPEQVQTGEELQRDRLSTRVVSWVWWPALFLLLYVLAVGPAAHLRRACPSTQPVLDAAYTPLKYLAEHSQAAGSFFVWYVGCVWRIN